MRYVVAFYELDRACGGPEEGGWYFDTGTPARPFRICRNKQAAFVIAARANTLLDRLQRHRRDISLVLYDGGRYGACVFENNAPAFFPERRPIYT